MPSEKTSAVTTHILGIFTLFLGPLVMYFLLKRNASPWLRDHLDEAVNYHILVLVAFAVLVGASVLLTNLGWTTVALLLAGLAVLIAVASVVFGVIAVVKAAGGKSYHFPLDVKIVR